MKAKPDKRQEEQARELARCFDCEEWEPILNTGSGWCPVFSKETTTDHGSQCTAFARNLPNVEVSECERK